MMVFIPRRAHLGRYRQIATTAARHGLLPRLESPTLADTGSAVSANRWFWSADVLSLRGEPVVDDVRRARAGVRWPITLTAIVVASFLALAAACGGGEQQVSGPRLLLKGDTFDLGSVAPGQERPVAVPFENGGTAPLSVEITSVRPAPRSPCGCGVQDFSVDRPQVAPGEKGNLVFTLKGPEGAKGMEDTMLVDLQTNEPDRPERTITIKYEIE